MEQALIVRRWRRYGADRLYVTADTGAPLGSVDLATGQVALEALPGASSAAAGAGASPGAPAAAGDLLAEAVRRAAQAYLRADLPEVVVPVAELVRPPAPAAATAEPARARGRRARTTPAGAAEPPASVPRDPAARGRHRADGLVRPWADGEHHAWREEPAETLCDRLDRLVLEGWHVLHDVPVGRQGSVVAHLLVGGPGAFAVAGASRAAAADGDDAVAHDGAPGAGSASGPRRYVLDGRYLSADGHGVPDLRDVRLTAARAGSLLRAAVGSAVTVRGVLVVPGTVEHRAPAPFDALVVPDGSVPEVFATLPQRWTPGRVDAVAAVARRRATWALSRAL